MLFDKKIPVPAGKQDTGLQNSTVTETYEDFVGDNLTFYAEEEAISFLERYSPEGPWTLVTFGQCARGYTTTEPEKAKAFVQEWDGKQDVYFLLGMPKGEPNGQPKKEMMLGTTYLWVDCDPREEEDLLEERKRILMRLTSNLPEGIPAPTCIVDSGRGYWGLWKLNEPCWNPILAENYNKRIAELFGVFGDKCWNINRVCRLSGTVNSKIRRRARIVSFNDARYSLEDLPSPVATTAVAASVQSLATSTVPIPVTIDDLSVLDEWKVPERIKCIIEHGRNPEEGSKEHDDSRSIWVFDALCHMVRANVPDGVMLGILTDQRWGISESIFHRRNGNAIRDTAKHAWQQIENARNEVNGANRFAQLECDDKGNPYRNQNNIRTALQLLGVQVRFDLFHDRLLIEGLTGFGPLLNDEAMTRLWLLIDERYRLRVGKDFFWSVVQDTARRDSFHPVLDYLDSLNWDGQHRLDGWLTQYGGAADTPYARAVGSLMLVAAVRRVRSPGCKFDEMLVLEGDQGTNKSSALAVLSVCEDWFSDDLPLNADGKRVIESLAGRWIIEAAELKGMRKGDVEHLKAFLSRNTDRARMSYARLSTEVQRQCVIFGTTNSSQYLRDGTGNRRFWPVRIERFDLEALFRDRDQLWAEAAQREARGERIRLAEELWPLAAAEQQKRELEDPYFLLLQEVLGDAYGKIKARDVWEILEIPIAQRGQEHNARIGEAMRQLGWERTKLRFGGKSSENCYARGTAQERGQRLTVRVIGEKPQVMAEHEAQSADAAF